jgi:di/tricarboxylate transporter
MPLSFASMLGGMLTLIGTSTNLLASETAARLGEEQGVESLHAFSMFEFTHLGAIVLVVGSLYLFVVAPRLLPDRVPAQKDYLAEYEVGDYLSEVMVRESSPIVGKTVRQALDYDRFDADVLGLVRDEERYIKPIGQKVIQAGDTLTIRTDRETLTAIAGVDDLSLTGTLEEEAELEPTTQDEQALVEVVIQSGSSLAGRTLASSAFQERYDANVLAFRSRGETVHERMDNRRLRVGDTLLVQAARNSIDRLSTNPDFIVAHEPENPDYRTGKIPHAVGIILGVVLAATVTPLHIVTTALGGVVAMVGTGVLHPSEVYESVDWDVIFLLAGVIPLGIALEQTGAAELLGLAVGTTGEYLPALGVLWVFYVFTGLITSVISNNASVVLMIPVAVEAAIEVVGEAGRLAVDANGRFDLKTTLAFAEGLAPYGVRWYEEAGDPLDYAIQQQLGEHYAGPSATGENLFSHQDVRNLLRYGGMRADSDILQMDPVLSYGLVEYLRILEVLHQHGWSPRQCIPHGGHQFALNIAAGLKLGGNESYPRVFAPFGGFADSTPIEEGGVAMSAMPGIGFEDKRELMEVFDKHLRP